MTERTIFRQALLSLLAGPLLLAGGCGENAPGGESDFTEGIPSEVTFSISALTPKSTGTRADGTPMDPEHDNEKINDWFLVFADREGTIRKILHRSDAETNVADKMKPVEAETFRCTLPSGTYSIYAFANISEEDLSKASGVSFLPNGPTDRNILAATTWKTGLNLWNIDEDAIPMTGYLGNVKIKNTVDETFSIEVVRMLAKIELRLTNASDKRITVNSVSLDPVTLTPVSLFPNGAAGISYDFLGDHAYTPVEDAAYGPLTYTPKGLEVAAKTTIENPERCVFYINESISKRDNGNAFTIGLNVSHEDGVKDYMQYNITADIHDYINRNDWIMIPISLSQYDVSVEALFYPPIGGYPAFLSTVDPEGSQVFTFGTQGEFSIVPYVTDKEAGRHLTPQRYSISLTDTDDPAGIFERKPTVSTTSTALPDEITGRLSAKTGTATIKLSVDVYDKPQDQPDSKKTQTYTRRIHITRDNNVTQ